VHRPAAARQDPSSRRNPGSRICPLNITLPNPRAGTGRLDGQLRLVKASSSALRERWFRIQDVLPAELGVRSAGQPGRPTNVGSRGIRGGLCLGKVNVLKMKSILIGAVIAICLAGCGGSGDQGTSPSESTTVVNNPSASKTTVVAPGTRTTSTTTVATSQASGSTGASGSSGTPSNAGSKSTGGAGSAATTAGEHAKMTSSTGATGTKGAGTTTSGMGSAGTSATSASVPKANAALPGWVCTQPIQKAAGGLQYIDCKLGSGAPAKSGESVTVNYTGYLTNGTKFDSSLDHGQPFTFQLGAGQVIKGWDQGVAGMKPGGQRKLIIPSDLAYGDNPSPGSPIPPGATLVFDVELLSTAPA
jgi:FKBP-type peptidyl-prolyl cis-trans isomerase